MPRTGANARPARAPKEPKRFADEAVVWEPPPSALRRAAERRAAERDRRAAESEQGTMTGGEFVAQEKEAAEAAGFAPQREKAPIYNRDERPKKVTLPRGWKPSSKKEVEKYFENLNREETREMVRLHLYAFFSGGSFDRCSKDNAVKFIRDNGLVVGPWHKEDFPGMCCSKELAKQRFAKAAQDKAQKKSDDATMARLAGLGLPKDEQTHDASYQAHVRDDMLTAAFLREEPMPKGRAVSKKVQEWLPLEVDICVDCGRRRELVRVEHANGGEHDGERRVPPCWADNIGERANCDAAIHAAHEEGETLTEDGYADILGVRLAYARRDDASAEDLAILAKAEALAADAIAPEDQEALDYASTLRCRLICNDYGPTYEEARRAFEKKEAARVAALQERDAASRARLAALPAVRCGTRVVVVDPDDGRDPRPAVQATMGACGVVRTRGTGWFHVELDGASGTTTGYRRAELAIDKSRKPAARKPSARKPAARKPAAKPAARKPSVRKLRK